MPKLSIKLDKKTFEQLKNKADEEHTTISKYAEKKLNESLHKEWPEYYSDLFGAIDDKTFDVEKPPSYKYDLPRERL